MYQKSQTNAVKTLVPETRISTQNACILRPTDNDEKTRTQPASPKRPIKRLNKVEKIVQLIATLMLEVKARFRDRLRNILATRVKDKDPQECKCSVCKRARTAEQDTKTNGASDAQPMMIRSIRIVQEKDKVPPETTTGTAQPKRSSPSTGITLEKKLMPRKPMTAQLTSLSEAIEEKFRQLNSYKYPEEQLKQVTRRLTHLAPHCTPHPRLIDLMHGSLCAGRQQRPLCSNSDHTPSSSSSVPRVDATRATCIPHWPRTQLGVEAAPILPKDLRMVLRRSRRIGSCCS
jgi:hypothetical protein